MEFAIQMGYGLQGGVRELLDKWGTGNVIVSARAFRSMSRGSIEDRMAAFTEGIREKCGFLLLDPLMYSEGASPISQLSKLSYWKSAKGDLRANIRPVVGELSRLNLDCGTNALVIPSLTTCQIDGQWASYQYAALDCASSYFDSARLIPTIAISADVLKDMRQVEHLMMYLEEWGASSVYLACEHPHDEYLVDDPQWLLNLMLLTAWIKRTGKTVVMGYASHQMLQLALCKCDYICSGNFLNVRRFKVADYEAVDADSQSRRTRWYYAPHVLSEFRLVTLDLAYQYDLLDLLKSPYGNAYSGVLFGGAPPSSTAYSESDSFKHYLDNLHAQCTHYSTGSYAEAIASIRSTFNAVESMIGILKERGISDQSRSFFAALPTCYQAIDAFDSEMGFQMSRAWDGI